MSAHIVAGCGGSEDTLFNFNRRTYVYVHDFILVRGEMDGTCNMHGIYMCVCVYINLCRKPEDKGAPWIFTYASRGTIKMDLSK